jgi:hypothetical protein
MDRRQLLQAAAFAGVGLVPGMRSLGARTAGDITAELTRAELTRKGSGCLWGAHAEPRAGEDGRSAITHLESMIGRRLAISRHYVKWDYPLPDSFQAWSVRKGRIPYVGWHAETMAGQTVTWSSIAAGDQDDWIARQARSLRAAGFKMFFAFHTEPENDIDKGGSAEFVAAYSRIRDIFRSLRVRNLRWVVTITASTYAGGHGGPGAWMPSSFRYCGVDGYNTYPCSGAEWRAFKTVFGPARDFARAQGKPLFIGEYGCPEQDCCGNTSGDPGAKAAWFRDAADTIKSWPEVKAAVYSHVYSDIFGCAFWVDTRRRSLKAFRRVGSEPYFS